MDFDDQVIFPEIHHNSGLAGNLMTYEDDEDFAAMGSGISVASSEWRNVSSSSSSSSIEDELTAKDIVNWREFWDIWSTHYPVVTTDVRDIPADHPFCQDIYSVFQFSYRIPRSRFNMHHVSDPLQGFFAQVTKFDPDILSENASVYPQLNIENGLAIASAALEVHRATMSLVQEGGDTSPDEYWATQIHLPLIVRCARGRLLRSSEAWSLQTKDQFYPQIDLSPTASKILRVRKLHPFGAIPVGPEIGTLAPGQVLPTKNAVPKFFAAAFSTRSQVASQLRDTPEPAALHSFSIMATSAVLAQMNACGISLPVFGVMFDRNIVRFHVDWSMTAPGKQISVPLPQTDQSVSRLSPFRDFDLTLPDDSLRVAFILDAVDAYAQSRLTPAIRAIFDSCQAIPHSDASYPRSLALSQNEISSEERVKAWMQSGAVSPVGIYD